MKTNLAEQLKVFRTERKLTQTELAEKLNITQRTYSFYETGRNEPSIETLVKLADLYNTSLDILVGRYTRNK